MSDTAALDPDTLLSTTRAVRRRLDLERPVARELVEECLRLAQQAPSGGNRQSWAFVVVTDPERRRALAELYRAGWERYRSEGIAEGPARPAAEPAARQRQRRITDSARHLADNLERVPVHVIPCIRPRTEGRDLVVQASVFGSVLPAVWSFMLAARARGLGTAWTTLHLFHEREAAEVLGIPWQEYQQVALIPLAHTVGTSFRPGPRADLETFVHWEGWGD
ncbi:MAG TPA: nitroreductase family protein [Miltoncostaeaceae bacterium]|nr:nitroreductase family protein [Miltoncostaeaceae bacterium]